MFESHNAKHYVLDLVTYVNKDELIDNFYEVVIKRAEEKHTEIVKSKSNRTIKRVSVNDILNKNE